ncbi:thioredoxin family protein [bacterium]|nr:thioredoxin family protein [bacterium]
MLNTNLKHLSTKVEAQKLIESEENVLICCGRMGPMCVPVYAAMEELENEYPTVEFRDMVFDIPDASFIRELPECATFRGLPFTVYYKKGKIVAATSSIQNKAQIEAILKNKLGQ